MYRLLKVIADHPDGSTKLEIIEGHAKLEVIMSTLAGCITGIKVTNYVHPSNLQFVSHRYEIQYTEGNVVTVIAKLKFDHT